MLGLNTLSSFLKGNKDKEAISNDSDDSSGRVESLVSNGSPYKSFFYSSLSALRSKRSPSSSSSSLSSPGGANIQFSKVEFKIKILISRWKWVKKSEFIDELLKKRIVSLKMCKTRKRIRKRSGTATRGMI
nr:hypothetical protein [Tanacetum cinerariifolium]